MPFGECLWQNGFRISQHRTNSRNQKIHQMHVQSIVRMHVDSDCAICLGPRVDIDFAAPTCPLLKVLQAQNIWV